MSATKRKLADAFNSLDQAVEPSPPPAKRPHVARSLYSTLAKYGVKPKQANRDIPSLSKSTPHLSAILARAATRTRNALPFVTANTPPPLPPTAEYRPSSIPSFLARLATFKLATYANKPPQIDAVAAAKCGWVNDGKDRLVCGLCAVSWVVGGRERMSRDAANALVEKQRVSLVEMHKTGCPWKTRQCDPSIYRIPLQAPAATIREIKTSALVLNPIMHEIEVKHPLTASQLVALRTTITAFSLSTATAPSVEDATAPPTEDPIPAPEPSETAILTALFGWAPAPPAPERPRVSSFSRPSSRAASRAGSPFPSTPTRPIHSRAASLALPTPVAASPSSIPLTSSTDPAAAPSTPPRQFLRRISSVVSLTKRDASLLHCALCQRRVGLWAFAPPAEPVGTPPPSTRAPPPQRHFDLLKEHRSFCPYVVRSTVVPTLPAGGPAATSESPALEGWRAVLTVVLRYGMVQRQRTAALRRKHPGGVGGDTMDVDREEGRASVEADAAVDGVEAMVATVKSRGGKDLLLYVKKLLG
ncbi:C3HC zinc finger-like-domain-containing protein [Mycena belliarum]|uniref:C3HC zinc finger-like-domain-containing protein n=1 Tax=Mycena belliarum TaxID=1033014 RepID=A0AAD6Y2A6_9AGAR|nr:C3HC zinc finger-like-domain-containing protein [Mycena belliae]